MTCPSGLGNIGKGRKRAREPRHAQGVKHFPLPVIFLDIEDCRKLVAFVLFYVRSTDLEWYRVLTLDEVFRPLTAAEMPPSPVGSPEEIMPLLRRAELVSEQLRRMALQGFAFSVWLASDQVRQAVAMCKSEADARALRGLIETEIESDSETTRWE